MSGSHIGDADPGYDRQVNVASDMMNAPRSAIKVGAVPKR
jgi:hypothetical protein